MDGPRDGAMTDTHHHVDAPDPARAGWAARLFILKPVFGLLLLGLLVA